MSRKLTVVKQGGPPANPPQRSYLDFEKFVKLEHDLCEFNDDLFKALERLDDNPAAGAWFAESVLKMTEDKLRTKVEAYVKAAAWYERDELYEQGEDGTHVRRHVISEHVAALLGSFPVAPHSPEVFVRRMIEEIVVLDPWVTDLERGCRQLIRDGNFPNISSLLKAIKESNGTESYIDELIDRGDGDFGEYQIIITYRELAAELGKAQLAIEEAEELKKPIHVNDVSRFQRGDRVVHIRFGDGEVGRICGQQISVRFDKGGLKTVIDRFLEPA